MASNKELRDQIGALQAKLGLSDLGVDTEKLNNSQLTELAAKLEAQAAAPISGTSAGEGAGSGSGSTDPVRPIDGKTGELAKDVKQEQPAAPRFEYSVGPRASLMIAGRVLTEGQEVVPERDVPSAADLKNLIAAGAIVKVEPSSAAD